MISDGTILPIVLDDNGADSVAEGIKYYASNINLMTVHFEPKLSINHLLLLF